MRKDAWIETGAGQEASDRKTKLRETAGPAVRLAAALLIGATLWGGPALGQTDTAPQGPGGAASAATTAGLAGLGLADASSPVGPGAMAWKLGLSLVAVIGLILVLQRAARRYGGAFGAGSGNDKIRILSSRPVGPRLSLALVQVMDRTLLVGISPQGIRRVADLGCSSVSNAQDAGPKTPAHTAPSGSDSSTRTLAAGLRRWMPGAGSNGALQRTGRAKSPDPVPSQDVDTPPEPAGTRAGDFEGELSRRLAHLRDRYPTVDDLEKRMEGGRA